MTFDWKKTAYECAQSQDSEACAKAALTTVAEDACIAATEGAGAAVCTVAVPIIVDAVWKYAWPAAESIWNGATVALKDFANAFVTMVKDLFGGKSPWDPYSAIAKTWPTGDAYLASVAQQGLEAMKQVARDIDLATEDSAHGAVSGAAWDTATLSNAYRGVVTPIWNEKLVEAGWEKGFDITGTITRASPLNTPLDGHLDTPKGGGQKKTITLRFADKGVVDSDPNTAGRWTPAMYYPVGDFDVLDMPGIYQLAQQGFKERAGAVPAAMIETSTALVIKREQLDRESSGAGWLALLGLGAAIGLGVWLWRKK